MRPNDDILRFSLTIGAFNTPHSPERPDLLYGSWGEGASGPGRADAGVVGRCLGGRLSLSNLDISVYLHYE